MTDVQKEALLFGVRRSVRYHNRRTQFFERLNRLTNVLTALSGSATIITALRTTENDGLVILFAATAALFSTFDIVFNTAQSAKLHQDLARRFINLEKKFLDNNTDLVLLESERLDIESDEPPILRVIDSDCHNEMLRAMGYSEDEFVQIKFFQRLISPLLDFNAHKIKKKN